MPLIREFGRWLRSHSTADSSSFSRPAGDAPMAEMARTWAVIFVAVLGVVPIVVTGTVYEGVRALDRPNYLGPRGHWIAAVVLAVVAGIVLVAVVTRAG